MALKATDVMVAMGCLYIVGMILSYRHATIDLLSSCLDNIKEEKQWDMIRYRCLAPYVLRFSQCQYFSPSY
jgi:hypothetical protein